MEGRIKLPIYSMVSFTLVFSVGAVIHSEQKSRFLFNVHQSRLFCPG
jgi:hypothetical protein